MHDHPRAATMLHRVVDGTPAREGSGRHLRIAAVAGRPHPPPDRHRLKERARSTTSFAISTTAGCRDSWVSLTSARIFPQSFFSSFVDEGGGVQRVVPLPAPSLSMREPVQLVVDERQQLVEGAPIPRPELLEQAGHGVLVRGALAHDTSGSGRHRWARHGSDIGDERSPTVQDGCPLPARNGQFVGALPSPTMHAITTGALPLVQRGDLHPGAGATPER